VARSRKSSRQRLDWVYNEMAYNSAETTVGPGAGNAVGLPLTVSQSARRIATWGLETAVPAVGDYQSWAAIPEGGEQRVHAVEAHLMVRPSIWAAGNVVRIGFRLMLARMDATDGSMLLDPLYRFWQQAAGDTMHVAQFANAGFMREHVLYEVFGDNAQGWHVRMKWRSRRGLRIMDDYAVFVYMEGSAAFPGTSVTGFVVPRCRALVSEQT